jgi:hypothetical protein
VTTEEVLDAYDAFHAMEAEAGSFEASP